jgi:hypothetical protein
MALKARITMSGDDCTKCAFTLPAKATKLNRHGAAVQLNRELLVGSTIVLQNTRQTKLSARVVTLIIKNGHVSRDDLFFVMNPVSGGKITGPWTPPNPKNLVFWQLAPNQTTDIQVAGVFRDAFSSDVPWLYVSNIATNTFLNFIRVKGVSTLAQDTTTNEAVTATANTGGGEGDAGKVVLVNLTTGKTREFKQFNNGFYGTGYVNGLAVDSNTGIACITTNLNSQVAFYKLSNGTGV